MSVSTAAAPAIAYNRCPASVVSIGIYSGDANYVKKDAYYAARHKSLEGTVPIGPLTHRPSYGAVINTVTIRAPNTVRGDFANPSKPESTRELLIPSTRTVFPNKSGSTHDGKTCVHCNCSFKGRTVCCNVMWPDDKMCDDCNDELPVCLACERKAVEFCKEGAYNSPLPVGQNMFTCGQCCSLPIIGSPQSAAKAKAGILHFYHKHLKLTFTDNMLQNQRTMLNIEGIEDQGSISAALPVRVAAPEELNAGGVFSSIYGRCNRDTIPGAKKEGNRFISDILVMKGLPKIVFQLHLCHELFHAWMYLSGFPLMSPRIEEGICNAIAYLYLKYCWAKLDRKKPNSRIEVCKELIEFHMRKMERSNHPDYGDGFREAIRCIQTHGLHNALRHLWVHHDWLTNSLEK